MDRVVVSRDQALAGRLPALCICCGDPTEHFEMRQDRDPATRFQYGGQGPLGFLELANWLFNQFNLRNWQVNAPVCEEHRAAWRRRDAASAAFALAVPFAIAMFGGATVVSLARNPNAGLYAIAALGAVGFVACVAIGLMRNGSFKGPPDFRVDKMTDTSLHLSNVAPKFGAALHTEALDVGPRTKT